MRAGVFHYGTNGALGDSVERVHVWWACGLLDQGGVHEVLELVREELTGIVRVEGADDFGGFGAAAIQMGVHGGDVGAYALDGLAFFLEEVDGFEACVIVYHHESVLEVANGAVLKWAHYVAVNESTRVGCLVYVVRSVGES